MSLQEIPLNQLYQPFSDEQLVDPYPVYALARQQQLIFYTEQLLSDAGVYVVTRHDDITQINIQPDRNYSAAKRGGRRGEPTMAERKAVKR